MNESDPGGGASLRTAIIFTPDAEGLAAWYAALLGLGPWDRAPGHLGQRVGPVYLGFDEVPEPAGTSPSRVTLWFDVPDVAAVHDRAVASGANSRSAPARKPWGDTLASVIDPDGNIVGLASRA